jgi:hypothetical protein
MWPTGLQSLQRRTPAGYINKPAPTLGSRGFKGGDRSSSSPFSAREREEQLSSCFARTSQGSVQSNGVEQQSGALLRAPGVPPLPRGAVPRCVREPLFRLPILQCCFWFLAPFTALGNHSVFDMRLFQSSSCTVVLRMFFFPVLTCLLVSATTASEC